MLSQRSSVRGRRHANGPPERSREARFRGKLAIKRNLAERRASRRDHDFRAFQPTLPDVAMRGHAHGGGKYAGEVKDAETRDIGEVGDGDVFSEMLIDIRENTSQPSVIQAMSRLRFACFQLVGIRTLNVASYVEACVRIKLLQLWGVRQLQAFATCRRS